MPRSETKSTPAPASAPVHVLHDEGLVRLVDGHLAFGSPSVPLQAIRLGEISQVSIFGNAGMTSPCVRELIRRGIPIVWRSAGGRYLGHTLDLSGAAASARRVQYRAADDPQRALTLARSFVSGKIVNARGLLRRSQAHVPDKVEELRRLAPRAEQAQTQAELLGIEGAAAAAFYAAMPALIVAPRRADFAWEGRRRRPPADPVNALLSYLYAVVCGECATAALAAGLDPAVGFLHAERPGRPALALDLLEPFRPAVADAVALAVINRGEAKREHFSREENRTLLNDQGRRVVLAALERRWAEPVPGQSARARPLTWREAVSAQARNLVSALRSGGAFVPFTRS